MSDDRFDRNERLFGKEGQNRLRCARVAVMGCGGLGSIVAPELALLGVGTMDIFDRGELSTTNRNRYMGVCEDDPIPGSTKVALAERHIRLINPKIEVTARHEDILSKDGLDAIKHADYVIGCVDNDGVRFFLNEACLAYGKTLIDLASDAPEEGFFGGRVAIADGIRGCLVCLNLLDAEDVRRFLSSLEMQDNERAAYGINIVALEEAGPSVVSINGVVASLGVTVLMSLATEIDVPFSVQTYYGHRGTVNRRIDPAPDSCYYCKHVRGREDEARIERYFS